MPAGAVDAIFVHFIAGVGWLETDDYAMTEQATPPGFSSPMVSLTFDDGSQGFYDNALPRLDAKAFKTTQYIPTLGLTTNPPDPFMMTKAEISTVARDGNEIGGHSVTHPDLRTVSDTQLATELTASKATLEAIPGVGTGTVTDFAYPFGTYDARVIAAEQAAGYVSGRSVEEGYNSKLDLEPYDIRVQNMTPAVILDQFKAWVDYAKAHNFWLVIVYHEVQPDAAPVCQNPNDDPSLPTDPDPCIGPYDTTITQFQAQLDYISSAGLGPNVMTVKQALTTADAQAHSPVAGSVSITPTAPTTNALLTATPSAFTDPDGDVLSYTYQWSVAGTDITGATGPTFDLSQADHGDRGDAVAVVVKAVDPQRHESTVVTASVTVANTAPVKGAVAITPPSPRAGVALTATPSGFSDADNDLLTYRYQWSVNGKAVEGATGATLDHSTAVTGDTVAVVVSADDGHGGTSENAEDSVTLGNTAPTAGAVALTPDSPKAGATLKATPTGFADADNDPLTYHYQWSVNGKTVDGATGATLDHSTAVGGDVVSVAVWADDGHQGTSDSVSASATLVNTAPTKGSVTISPASRTAGTALTAEPTGFADVDGDALTYQYVWFHNGQQIAGATGATLAGSATIAGEIRVDVRATDGHGGTSDAATLTVDVSNPPVTDKIAPTIAILAPKATTYAFLEELLVSFRCTDGSGVASCTATLARTGAKPVSVVSGQKVRLSQTGRYVLRITAEDRIGNSASTTLQFSIVDRVAPRTVIASPKAKTYRIGQKLAITFSCTDPSGIAGCTATLGRVGTKARKVSSGKKITLSTAGQYVLRITAKDHSGNAATKTLKFRVKGR